VTLLDLLVIDIVKLMGLVNVDSGELEKLSLRCLSLTLFAVSFYEACLGGVDLWVFRRRLSVSRMR
jgi:hypothetical protein